MKNFVIMVAGGSGSRMQSSIPKQFLLLNKKPILLHSLQKFITALPGISIILVLPEAEIQRWEAIKTKYSFNYPLQIAKGGSSRSESVHAGLRLIREEGIVGIHDAVRPLVSVDCIQRCYQGAQKHGNAVPVIGLRDSIRKVDGENNTALNRSDFRLVQTPQCFQLSLIKEAFERLPAQEFTDDAGLLEAAGYKIQLVEGNEENVKITTRFDLKLGEVYLRKG